MEIELNIGKNQFDFELDTLFEMGARINPKRSFLFISKLLGKHLEVNPNVPKATGHLLANLLNEEYFSDVDLITEFLKGKNVDNIQEELLKQVSLELDNTIFIGFAETATGLGHSVASAFKDSTYVHTSRDAYLNKESIFNFEEEHSHATSHFCYLSDIDKLNNAKHIVLIDDEITTGNTCLNLIKSLNNKYPNKRYSILTLLDWRTAEYEKEFNRASEELGLDIDIISLIRGSIEVKKEEKLEEKLEENREEEVNIGRDLIIYKLFERTDVEMIDRNSTRPLQTGKFGTQSKGIEESSKNIGDRLKLLKEGKNTLCVGTGELIYIPSRIASYMGDVMFKSSSRSPIYVDNRDDYIIQDKLSYTTDDGITKHIYNIGSFDEVFMFFEEVPSSRLREELSIEFAQKGIKYVKFVTI